MGTEWNSSRLLRFDLGELFRENGPNALLAEATLLHREHNCPSEGAALLDRLAEFTKAELVIDPKTDRHRQHPKGKCCITKDCRSS
jgi:hypothetical protein